MHTAETEPEQIILATIGGKPFTDLPPDLFIPPDALEVLLDSFTGPLDLLLYLIRKQNLDILDIPIALITRQYMQYIQLMTDRMELAADYLVMAAMLAEIKSRMLLPQTSSEEEIEEDPRAALVRKLQLYEQFKQAALQLDELPREERDFFSVNLPVDGAEKLRLHPDVSLQSLIEAMAELITRQGHQVHHQIMREPLSVRERMAIVLERLQQGENMSFVALLNKEEGRMGIAVTLLAVLELARQSIVIIIQTAAFEPIHIREFDNG
ncbi:MULTISPECIES: ScpA family protein [Legionella]|uniref:Segregation and condensation protein A n=1 Tax=Legionella quinlivanii TaxID=45073 RepID=A0A364LLY2_9GAMM|nr:MULTISPECIES: ScpA family protein [Legionella]MCE3043892.1 segregation/condensation protein A [Legionella sp. 16cNR16C]RAP37887.1 segregation/condensation protein A [Legionella quinlivanii]